MHLRSLLALSGLLSGLLSGAAAHAELRVDLLAFTQNGSAFGQVARPLPPCHAVLLKDGPGAESAFAGGDTACTRRAGHDTVYTGFASVGPSNLGTSAGKLKAAGYGVLVNKGWRQAGTGQSPVILRAGRVIGGQPELEVRIEINGTEKLPEVVLELVLTRLNGELPEYVVMREIRRMKPGEPHYLDHPVLGAIVQVNVP